jgi:predicted ATPase
MSEDEIPGLEERSVPMPQPSQDNMAKIVQLSKEAADLEETIKEAEFELAKLKKKKLQITHNELPEIMRSLGMTTFSTENGAKVELQTYYEAKKYKDFTHECHTWLRQSGNDGIIKNEIKTDFSKGDDEKAQKLLEFCEENSFNYSNKEAVHPMTLKSFIKECYENGTPPPECFGVYVGNFVKIK